MRKNWSIVHGYCIVATILLLHFSLDAQTIASKSINTSRAYPSKHDDVRALSVGDKVPGDLVIENIINFRDTATRIDAFKGKLILIDFWGTTCSSCIAALPKIDSLQRMYKDKVQVLTVTNFDTKEKVVNTLKRYKKTQNLTLPIVLNDVKLKKYFPHEMVSHVVWIDGSGVVRAITGTEYINARNIQSVLDGNEMSWPVKNDVFDFDYTKPFLQFSNANIVQPEFLYSSSFTSYIDGVNATDKIIVDSVKNIVTRNHFNHTLLEFCDGSLTGSGTGYINPKHLILNVKDFTRFVRNKSSQYYAEWARANTYCYSIALPIDCSEKDARKLIKDDLSRWLNILGINVKKENHLTNCLVLVQISKDSSLLQSVRNKYENGLKESGSRKWIYNTTISHFVSSLNGLLTKAPWIIDETTIHNDFKIDLNFYIESLQDLPSLRKELQKYGLDLLEAQREMEMYVITEKGFELP